MALGAGVCDRQVQLAITVEVSYGKRNRVDAYCDRRASGGRESTMPVTQQNGQAVPKHVRDRQVQVPIAVEISCPDEFGAECYRYRRARRCYEGSVSVPQYNCEGARIIGRAGSTVIGDCQV